jgi:hypothetical protein
MGFFKNLVLKQAIKKQAGNLPPEQQEALIKAFEKDPQFFENLEKQIKNKMNQGKGQFEASMEVMKENQDKLRKLMQ